VVRTGCSPIWCFGYTTSVVSKDLPEPLANIGDAILRDTTFHEAPPASDWP
jgi:hypothetical protein